MNDYNHLAGRSIERLAALSDGVFAVAMTLLVLDLHAPAMEAIHSEGDLAQALIPLAPRLLVYMMSFLTLGIFWVGQQTQLNAMGGSNRTLSWIHLGFLFAVSLMPFSTALMAEFIAYRLALLLYWANILLLGLVLFASWRYAFRAGLLRETSAGERAGIERRIVVGQALYAFGAALCVFSTYASLGFIVLVQLNYAIAPRIGVLSRI
jgi:uncharacterized membrane protein